MRVIDPGHHYVVDGYDDALHAQPILFLKRVGENYPGNTYAYGGTNCQELLRVLIDRVKYLDRQKPCNENVLILANLRSALRLFETRAARMHDVTVNVWPENIEDMPADKTTGHIFNTRLGTDVDAKT